MRLDHPDEHEQRRIFEELLASVSTGGGIYSCNGLDMETEDALWGIARAHPAVAADMVDAARAAFAGQLDGSHAAARRAARLRKFEELAQRRALGIDADTRAGRSDPAGHCAGRCRPPGAARAASSPTGSSVMLCAPITG